MKTILLLSLFSFTLLISQKEPNKVISIEELTEKKEKKDQEIQERLSTLKNTCSTRR